MTVYRGNRVDAPSVENLELAIMRCQEFFRQNQYSDGYWWGELESNPTMEAEYVMLTHYLRSPEGDRIARVANDIRRRQAEDGSWNMYHGAPGDLSTTIECYFALKLMGDDPDAPPMQRARDFILAKGGTEGPGVHENLAGAVQSVGLARSAGVAARADVGADVGAVQFV